MALVGAGSGGNQLPVFSAAQAVLVDAGGQLASIGILAAGTGVRQQQAGSWRQEKAGQFAAFAVPRHQAGAFDNRLGRCPPSRPFRRSARAS